MRTRTRSSRAPAAQLSRGAALSAVAPLRGVTALAAVALLSLGMTSLATAPAHAAPIAAADPQAQVHAQAQAHAHAQAERPAWAVAMLRQVNAVRARAGVKPLTLCPPLMRASAKHARVMAATGHFEHVGPDGSQPWDRAAAEGYRYRAYGENIAAGQRSVAAVMRAWARSPGHRANLVSRQFTHLGVGHAVSGAGTDFWVQSLGAGGRC